MPSELETRLVTGGLAPALAKIIANAIDNTATSRLSTGNDQRDATPIDKMRLITSDTRRYQLTNLDHAADSPFRERLQRTDSRFQPRDTSHPYEGSQPSGGPTLTTGSVKAGDYVAVSAASTNGVSQSMVSLQVAAKGGRHARLNAETKQIESVPILVEVEPKNRVTAVVEERADATVIKLRFLQ